MKNLNLERLWMMCNALSEKEQELGEKGIWVYLLGRNSSFAANTFEIFLEYYSFKVNETDILVFNDSPVPYEDYTVGDFSSIPIAILDFGEKELEEWVQTEVEKQLKQQEEEKLKNKENIRQQIARLEKELNS